MVKGTEIGHAAKEFSQYAADKAQESWERRKEGEERELPKAPSGTGFNRSNSWFSRNSTTNVFRTPLGSTSRFSLPAPAPPQLPALVIRCLQVLDREEVIREYVGLYRISASRRELDRLRAAVEADSAGDVDFGWWEEEEPRVSRDERDSERGSLAESVDSKDKPKEDPNAVAGLLKAYLREGESVLFPFGLNLNAETRVSSSRRESPNYLGQPPRRTRPDLAGFHLDHA
jgi:hypothetical protein